MNNAEQNISRGEHILILTPGFPQDEADDTCIPPLQEFLLKFKSIFTETKISVFAFQYPYLEKEYEWNGIKVYSLAGKNSIIKKILVWIHAIILAKKIHRDNSVDVIHSFWLGECALIGNYLSKKLNCKHICTLMGQDVKSSNKYIRWLHNSNLKLIAVSKNQADEFFRLTKRNIDEIIHWGIEEQPVNNNIKRDIDLLGVGSLIPLKNYSLFIKLAEEAIKIYPDLNCVLAGTGPELPKLKTIAEDKKLMNNIEFTGLINRKDIFKLMQRSKILIHPSLFEGFGFVFAEALVNGMNIVSFNVGHVLEHSKWFIAKNEKDFINITINLLSAKLDFGPFNPFPLAETAKHYDEIYGTN